MIKEEWRAVVGYEGLYEVSNFGNVRSLDHYGYSKGHKSKRVFKGKILTCSLSRASFRVVFNDRTKHSVHRLVAFAFPEICGEWFEDCQVHHKDFDFSNNRADNLMVLTAEEHFKIHYESGKNQGKNNPNFNKPISEEHKKAVGAAHAKKVIQMSPNGDIIKVWPSTKECGRETGFCPSSIARAASGKKHYLTAYGYLWKYA